MCSRASTTTPPATSIPCCTGTGNNQPVISPSPIPPDASYLSRSQPCGRGRMLTLATSSRRDLTRDLQAKISRARDQLLVFLVYPGQVAPTNNGSERLLHPAAVQQKVTNGYRAMWAAEGEAAIHTVVDTARLGGTSPFATIFTNVSA
nr:transposase [Methylobacterium mesophilicum]